MPYHLSEDGLCVLKEGDSEPLKCYKTHEEALDYLRALEANVEDAKTIDELKAIEKETGDMLKVGSRHSATDNTHLRNAIDEILQAGGTHERIKVDEITNIPLEPEKTVTHYGKPIKALGDGKVGGYLVSFEGLDLEGDYFTKDTDFGEFSRLPVLYHHGFDDKLKTRRIGTADVKQDEVGLWAEAQLALRDEYEQMIYKLAEEGKLGWSSGAAAHVVNREADGKGKRITQWYMAEASLTPTPAEIRNTVIPLKSFLGVDTATPEPEGDPEAVKTAESEGTDSAEKPIHPEPIGDTKMEITPELQALMEQVSDNSIKKFRESEPATKTADIKIVKDEAEQPFKNSAEYFMAVKTAGIPGGQWDRRLLPLQVKAPTGLGELVPSEGGFLIPEAVAPGIRENIWKVGSLLSLFKPIPVSGNNMTFNMVDETSRALGSRYGGVRGYWLAEAAQKTSSHPLFSQAKLKLKKVAALVYATDELLEDVNALDGWIRNTVPNELRFMIEDSIINGDGVAKPLGILPSPALNTVTRIDAAQISTTDVANMWSARYPGVNDYVWIGNQFIFPQLLTMVVGTLPAYLPAGGLAGNPYATLFGRPYFDSEYCPVLGSTGDLLLFSPSQYLMIEKAGGIQAAESIHVNFIYDESVFRFVARVDGEPAWHTTLTMFDGTNTVSPFVALTTST